MQYEEVELEFLRQVPGRAVLAEPNGRIHVGRGYEIFSSTDEGASWERVTCMPRSPLRRAAGWNRLATRLFRNEIRALARLSDGTYVAANREGVFHGRQGDREMRPSHVETGDLKLLPPMRITVGPEDAVVWGEYVGIRTTRPFRLFASHDSGRTHQIVHTFDVHEVDHIHNVAYDEVRDHYWILAGDIEDRSGIGRLSKDFRHFEWLVKGEQTFRAVQTFDLGDRLLYATDTELEQNALITVHKDTGAFERHREFEGSCIYGCRYGSLYAISTSVEPSEVNEAQDSGLWLSRDGFRWKRGYAAVKDGWNGIYFQFGSIVLPSGNTESDTLYFSGQAVKGIDGQTVVARLAPGAEL